ncbi:MAG TPA: CGNR zinc finger domain-containing protein [Candidatus Acidoferrales bacterium]|nr:CGNR zinc finger domain-containing protein [Candidatus Acidoferrales bacterium]
MKERFQLVAGDVALDFVNTLDNRYAPDRLTDLLANYEAFLKFAVQTGMIAERRARKLLQKTDAGERGRILERVIELREAMYFLFRSIAVRQSPKRECLETFNRFLAGTCVPEAIVWGKRQFTRQHGKSDETSNELLWPIIDAAANLLTSQDRNRIRECSDEKCRWLFVDRSKNHSRRWCDMRVCGNRAKVRRFHARRRNTG